MPVERKRRRKTHSRKLQMCCVSKGAESEIRMKFIQLNLNHCAAAQDLLKQTVCEIRPDVAIINEQYRNMDRNVWEKDRSGRAAVWACGNKAIEEGMRQPSEGFVRVKIAGVYIYSCYASPNIPTTEFKRLIDNLVVDASNHKPLIIGGDFNAWAVDWGSQRTNERGRILLEAFAKLDVILVNKGNVHTFRKSGYGSIVDLTFVSTLLARNIEWQVSEHYTHSDHQAIIFTVHCGKQDQVPPNKRSFQGWAKDKLDEDTFVEIFSNQQIDDGAVESMAEQVVGALKIACDAAMPRIGSIQRRNENYWWNDNIALLRKRCLKARREYQRSRSSPEFPTRRETFHRARRDLQKAIYQSKAECFKQLCNEADANPWGNAYRVVMSRLKGRKSAQITCPDLINKIVRSLFPESDDCMDIGPGNRPQTRIIEVTEEEILGLCSRIGDKKAPGLDGIPNRALKIALRTRPQLFAKLFSNSLNCGVFYRKWKDQKLILIPKPGKPLGEPQSYRPICLLDTIGKCMERVIYSRLQTAVEEVEGISQRQYGFRKAKSTIDAISFVTNMARSAIQGKGKDRKYCAIITLDIKNAFNSARWKHIVEALGRLNIPEYLIRIVNSYLSDRTLWFETDRGTESYTVTAGVPQGSVLGPLLWNIMYDGVFRLKVPEESTIVGFADDIAVVVRARYLDEVQIYANEAIRTIKEWMESVNLDLAEHKTEAVLISAKRKRETLKIQVGSSEITSSVAIKYLGVMIDDRLNFKQHIDYACEKAARVANALARMMPNVGGPKQSRRALLSRVTNSIILYGSPIWEKTLKNAAKKNMESIFRRSCLRVCSGYRTISSEAASVVAGIIPIDIAARELSEIHYKKCETPDISRSAIRAAERKKSIEKWQRRWENSPKGRWTYRLIPYIEGWINRKHGGVDYNLTQFLTGHGGYRSYLYRFGLDTSPSCPCCPGEDEDAEHVVFRCPRFMQQRLAVEMYIGECLTVGSIVKLMVSSDRNWNAISKFVRIVNETLKRAEEARRVTSVSRMGETQ